MFIPGMRANHQPARTSPPHNLGSAIKLKHLVFLCLATLFLLPVAQGQETIPGPLRVSANGQFPASPLERVFSFSDLAVLTSERIFDAPPCIEGKYYLAFQLVYDLGDRQTTIPWEAGLKLTLRYNTDSLWTKELSLDMASQLFLATVFHDTAVVCDENYNFLVESKHDVNNAPGTFIYLKVLLYKEPEGVFDPAAPLTLANTFTNQKVYSSWNIPGDRVVSYDLEWVYIADYENFTGTTAQEAFAFKEPAGVSTALPYHEQKLYYPSGRVWFRARAIGIDANDPDYRVNGQWNYDPTPLVVANHEPQVNWQVQTIFSEEGKYKKIMNYLDGSLRQRQVVTHLNSQEVAIVGESFYDFEGRPVVEALPVPAGSDDLGFRASFNLFEAVDPQVNANTSADRLKFHYDNHRVVNSLMNDTSGSSRYYSVKNDLQQLHRDLVPLANGHTYTQVEYTRDGTGRLARQAGVGEAFNMEGGHTTRYYYGEAAPAELIRLFGSNVGNASHYKKNMTVDANGQVSITYMDQEDRTIATALAGDPPVNTDTLTSFAALDPAPVTVNITGKNQKGDGVSQLTHTILNTVPNTSYGFRYDWSALAADLAAYGCQACRFDLQIIITDPDGLALDLSAVAGNQSLEAGKYEVKNITAADCQTATVDSLLFTVVLPSIGDYTLAKNVFPSELSYEEMRTVLSQDSAVMAEIEQIRTSYVVDSTDCEVCRETCTDAEAAINEAIDEIAVKDCENIYLTIEQHFVELYGNNDDTIYEVPQDSIEAHPDYCAYQLCVKNTASEVFEKQVARIQNWEEALGAGYDELLTKDPFFTDPNLSGYNHQGNMQSKLNTISLGDIPYDSDGDNITDGSNTFIGSLAQVTDPNNTNFYINGNAEKDPTGQHILYLDLMRRQAEYTAEEYAARLSYQRWTLFRNFYLEAKRKTKLEISEFLDCPKAREELGIYDNMPTEEDEVRDWNLQNDGLDSPVSSEEVEMVVGNLTTLCGDFSVADSAAIANHLRNYYNSNTRNIYRFIFRADIGSHSELVALQGILDNYGCQLGDVAQDDPLVCARDTVITLVNTIGAPATALIQSTGLYYYNALLKKRERQEKEPYFKQLTDELRNKRPQAEERANVPAPLPSQSEYDALIDIYQQMNEGFGWQNETGWATANPLVVEDVSNWYGVQVDANGHVVALDLAMNGLNGTMPTSIGDLVHLVSLNMSRVGSGRPNNLTGTLPSTLSSLVNLEILDLSSNRLSGPFPTALCSLTSLKELKLGGISWQTEELTGDIPLCISNLTALEILDLSEHALTGPFPAITGMSQLHYLDLGFNDFTGNVPANINALAQLRYIDLSYTDLGGAMPNTFWQLSNLEKIHLDKSWNSTIKFSGSIDPAIGAMTNLERIELRYNNFSGDLPVELGNCLLMDRFDVAYNNFTGTLPPGMSNWTNLSQFYLNDNHFFGAIPPSGLNIGAASIRGNKFTFTDILPFVTGQNWNTGFCSDGGDELCVYYHPQDSVDIAKDHVINYGESFTLTADVDRGTSPSSLYRWYKYVEGGNDIPLTGAASAAGHSFTFNNASPSANGYYYYTIENPDAPDLVLYSRLQRVEVIYEVTYKDVDICLAYDENNPALAIFNYTVNWEDEVQRCLENAAREDSVLVGYTIDKLYENRVSDFYSGYNTQCLASFRDEMSYTYAVKEYHYTLYYYDQVGNLVQTVPPKGVRPLSSLAVREFLAGNRSEPPHELRTGYRYNSLDQLVWQQTPDAGASRFWYDDKVQLRLSQNAQQALDTVYSYTKYDEQGRIIEVGEVFSEQEPAILKDSLESVTFPQAADYVLADITNTYYDVAKDGLAGFQQEHLRNRVAWVAVIDKPATDTTATYYSYDTHGNVKSLLQALPGIAPKRTDYLYDQVSGNVNFVMYQYDSADQFIHRYRYDPDNRLQEVFTSTDGYIWDREATYTYYLHGPLARVELGEYRVQGVDYYYTLQGWLKGVNRPFADDAVVPNLADINAGEDTYAFALGYYNGDYQPRNPSVTTIDQRDQLWTRYSEHHTDNGLYNGNIAWMVTDLAETGHQQSDRTKGMQAMLYRYDQLNRIVSARGLTDYQAGTGFVSRSSAPSAYDTEYTYDANGNLGTLRRYDAQGALQDDFTYSYYTGTNRLRQYRPIDQDRVYTGAVRTNEQLYRRITAKQDSYVPSDEYADMRATERIDLQDRFTTDGGQGFNARLVSDTIAMYQYDAIGNLVRDQHEGVRIAWTPYGKVREVRSHYDSLITTFRYDGAGNRIAKSVSRLDSVYVTATTRYLRDASGNVMAIYLDSALREQPIYGSSRLGMYTQGRLPAHRNLGKKRYELSNHLGNVLTVVTDNIGVLQDSVWATVASTTDYYPFGLEMASRTYQDSLYRYGFNGKEKDQQGEWGLNHYDYGFRIYNPALGRFLSVDPLTREYPWYTPYQFAGNKPIEKVDLDGLEDYNYRLLLGGKNGKTVINIEFDGENNDYWANTWLNPRPHHFLLPNEFGGYQADTNFETEQELRDYVLGQNIDDLQHGNDVNIAISETLSEFISIFSGSWRGKVRSRLRSKSNQSTAGNSKHIKGLEAGSIRNVNRDLKGKQLGDQNCTNCVIATYHTLKGNKSTAMPKALDPKTKMYVDGPVDASFLETYFNSTWKKTSRRQLGNIKEGEMGILYGTWKSTGEGHVLNVVNQNGNVRYLDGQVGKNVDISGLENLHYLKIE